MSAPEPTAAVPVDEVKPIDTPAIETEPKAEEPAAVGEVVTPAVEAEATPATGIEASTTEEPHKDETKVPETPKSQHPLVKFFSSLKIVGNTKPKAPKSPKEKKKEEAEPTAGEASTEVAEATEPVKEEVTDSAKESETPAPVVDTPAEEAKAVVIKEEKRALKVGRRLSARVGDLFKSKPKADVQPPAKVDEHPPKIDEPEPVAPLENPATDEPKAEESANLVDAATPVVAATA